MKHFVAIVSLLLFSYIHSQTKYSRVKILTDYQGLQLLDSKGIPVDHGIHKKDVFFISDFSTEEIQVIQDNGFSIEILIDDVQKYYVDQNLPENSKITRNSACTGSSGGGFKANVPSHFNLGTMGGFLTYEEFLAELDEMATAYPDLITSKAPISNFLTVENRPIHWVRISDNPTTDETTEPEVLYTAVHHAREPNSLSELVFYMWYLLENYSKSAEVKYLVDNTEIYFVPCINPDGYVYNHTTNPNGGGMHRKNRRNVGTSNKGVDLNRNYSHGWNTTGVSASTNNDTYPGASAFSEVETQAMKWFSENHDFVFASNAHTYAGTLLHPIGTTVDDFAVDHDYFQAYTKHMTLYNNYTYEKSSDMYPASGDSDDYAYLDNLEAKPKVFAMTPEVAKDGFWSPSANIIPNCQDMVFANLVMTHLPHKYAVTTDMDGTAVETLTGNFNHSILRLGQENGEITVSIVPIQGIQGVGAAKVYNLNVNETQIGAISYTLNPSIQFGDPIKFVLKTDYGLWAKMDTIEKTYGSPTLQFSDELPNAANWTGTWALTGTTYYSPANSYTDSPTGNYTSNSNKKIQLNNTIDLTAAENAKITFYAKWDIEAGFDMVQFEVSEDDGLTWQAQCGRYTKPGSSENGSIQPDGQPVYDGTQSSWVKEEINLSDYLGSKIKVRFSFRSDQGMNKDGFYFDDFQVLYTNGSGGSTTGLTDLSEDNVGIKAFPNPANAMMVVSFSSVLNSGAVQLFDQSGKLVLTKDITEPTNKIQLETSQVEAGVYTLKLVGNNSNLSHTKLVIMH